jgi:hypothetical protein
MLGAYTGVEEHVAEQTANCKPHDCSVWAPTGAPLHISTAKAATPALGTLPYKQHKLYVDGI